MTNQIQNPPEPFYTSHEMDLMNANWETLTVTDRAMHLAAAPYESLDHAKMTAWIASWPTTSSNA